MNPVPDSILACLRKYTVLSLAVCHGDMPWAANAFFAYDEERQRLLFLTSVQTRHGAMLAINAKVAGTITTQFYQIPEIHGVQFYGAARLLTQPDESRAALDLYYGRFPQARGRTATVWEIRLMQMKLTDNRISFGTKTLWDRQDG